jgi:hypothetical protein
MSFVLSLSSSLRRGVLAAGLLGVLVSATEAKYKTEIGGITITYSKDGAIAFFDADDGTLTIAVDESGGALKVVVGPSAAFFWGPYVDMYILADDAILKSVTIKGTDSCTPFVCGQVGSTSTFTLLNGAVGDTDFYGQDFGLGMVAPSTPAKVLLKNGWATAQVLGFAYESAGLAEASSIDWPEKHIPDGLPKKAEPRSSKTGLIRRIQALAK